jgi:PAS domain S-box-containing protein
MNRDAEPVVTVDERAVLEQALQSRKVAMHRTNLPMASLGSLFAALVLIAMLHGAAPGGALLGWLALLAGVLAAGLGLARVRPRHADVPTSNRAWLARFRSGCLAHGLVWTLAGWLPLPMGDALHLAILIVVLAGVVTSSFSVMAFDLVAALLFGVPVLVLLSVRLFLQADPTYWMLGIAVLGALLLLTVAAGRSHRMVRKYEALRLSESTQAEALRNSEHLLERTGATAGVGGWELDLATLGLRLTAQAYRIHDVPPVAKPTFEGFISLYGPEQQAHMRAGLAEVMTNGTSYDHELPLTTPRGRQRWVRLIGHPQLENGKVTGITGVLQDITERKRSEQELRAASDALAQKTQALQDTLDSISQGIVSIDPAGRPRVYNRRALQLLDLPPDIVGPDTTYDDVVRYQAARGDIGADASFVDEDGVHHTFESARYVPPDVYVRRTRSGALIEVRTRRLADGGLVRTYADVTAYFEVQRALRNGQAELRALLDAFPGFIAVMDANFVYTYANQRFASLLGKPREAIVGQSVRDVLGAARFDRLREHTTGARAGEQLTSESEYPASATSPRTWLQVTHAIGVEDSAGRRNTYAFGIDISERKHAELALTAAKDEAERANQAKSQFLSSMSHELRTPMNAILGFGQLLVADTTHPLAAPQREYVREILRGGRHLLNLINEVLDLAQVETGKLRISLEPVRVSELLHQCLALLRPLARDERIELLVVDETACDCLVQADRTRLKQVLLNLLSNAIKYNRTGGQVRIACTVGTDDVHIAIRDSGPGLGPEQRARLFQAFERLDAGGTSVEGAGLGLVLSKHLMDAMRGEIGLDSEVGHGSTFWIRLPRAPAPVFGLGAALPPASSERRPARVVGPRKVLYIEDNPVNVLLMEAMLSRVEGLQFITAALPAIGLQMAIAEQPDLILLDIQLPEMDGYEVLRRLRLNEASREIPAIAVSANAMPSDIEHGLAAGFVRYLTKPLDMQALIKAVEQALAAG